MLIEKNVDRRIFMVEDEQGIRNAWVECLAMEGYSVCAAQKGDEGLQKLMIHPPID